MYKKDKEIISRDEQIAEEEYYDFERLSHVKRFLFALGTVLEYTTDEYKDSILTTSVYNYGPTHREKVDEMSRCLNYAATILLIIDAYDNDARRRLEIMKIVNDIGDNSKEYCKLHMAIETVMECTTRGEELRRLLYLDVLDKPTEEKKQIYEKINSHKTVFMLK